MPLCCGGIGTPREPSAEEKEKLKTLLESKLESHIGRKPRSFEIVQITSQVVAGTNHFNQGETRQWRVYSCSNFRTATLSWQRTSITLCR
uniref:Cystatin homolog n=1 Tax=Schistosoma mansoni TaxID=6183 RepID=Q7M3R0_SCHMA